MESKALLIGTSDGIGLATTKRLLGKGWHITGISRSKLKITNRSYRHNQVDVCSEEYGELINALVQKNQYDLCIYFAGIGELLNPLDMSAEVKTFEVNLLSMIKTAALVIPGMVTRGQGHFIGLSSLADELLSAESPSYCASKAGFSSYLGGLALALKPKGVHVTNVRFGFVDTKMAKADTKPFMIGVEKAVDHLEICLDKKPVSYTAPRIVIPLVKLKKILMRLGID